MNQYKEAFNHILYCDRDKPHSYISDAYRNDFSALYVLVKKSIPRKPRPAGYNPTWFEKTFLGAQRTYVCPTCGNQGLVKYAPNGRNWNSYCYDCGQALDWHEE